MSKKVIIPSLVKGASEVVAGVVKLSDDPQADENSTLRARAILKLLGGLTKQYQLRTDVISDAANLKVGQYIKVYGGTVDNDGLGGTYLIGATLTDTTGGFVIVAGSKYANRYVDNSKVYNAELTGVPKAPTATPGATGEQLANLDFVNAMLGGNKVPTKNLSPNGYVKMANGLIIQWGTVATDKFYAFPVAFNSTPKLAFGSAGASNGVPRAVAVTTTGFNYSSANNANCPANYVAIGY